MHGLHSGALSPFITVSLGAAKAIESSQRSESDEDYQVLLARLREIVAHQLITADNALEDWNDIVPEDVAELKQKLQSNNTTEDRR